MPWDELCVTWAEVMQAAWPYQSTVPTCVHPSAQLLTLTGCCSPEEKSGWPMSAAAEDDPAHGQHTVSASQAWPRGDTHNFLPIWGPQCWCFILHLQPGSLVSQRVQCHYHCWGWSHTMVSTEAPQGCTLSLPAAMEKEAGEAVTHTPALPASGSTQSGIRDAWGAASTILPTLRGGKGLHPSYICVFAVCTWFPSLPRLGDSLQQGCVNVN